MKYELRFGLTQVHILFEQSQNLGFLSDPHMISLDFHTCLKVLLFSSYSDEKLRISRYVYKK